MFKSSVAFRKAMTWVVAIALLGITLGEAGVSAVRAQEEAPTGNAPLLCPSTLVFGDLAQCSISTPAEGDTYGFLGNAGDKILVRMSKSSGTLYPEIRIYSPGGLQLCQDWDYDASEVATCTLTTTGMHSILVGDYGGTKTGDYYLYLQRLNGPGNPTTIAFGQTLSDSILSPAEMDTFTFAANAGNKVIVNMAKSSGTIYPEIRVYSPTGSQLCQDWDYTTSEIATCLLTETGTYSILPGDYGGTKTGDYYIYLQRLNGPGSPLPIAFGQTLSGSILMPAEMDTYTFAASADNKVIVRVAKSSGMIYPEIRVYSPGGLQLCQDWDYDTSEIATCSLTENGTYSILVDDYGGTKTGDYYIYLQRLNGPGSPLPIAFGQTLSGSILTPAEMDTYTFTASAGNKVIVRMAKSSGTLYPEIRIYSPTGLQLCQDWDYTTSEIASCPLTANGVYSILVGDYDGAKTGDYYLYLQRLNGPGNPTSIAFGQTLSGSILMPAEMDTFTFAASAGDKVIARVTMASGTLYPEIRVYSPTGSQLCQDWDYDTSEIASCALTANGVYSILVGDYGGTKTGDYYLYLQRLNNPGNATSIGFGQTLFGSINTPAEMDAYKVTVRLSGKAIIRMSKSSGTLYPEIRVYGPTGLQLCQDWDYTTSEIASCTLTDVGSYLILAGDYDGTKTGDYYIFLQWLNTTGNPVSISGDAGAAGVKLTYLDGTPQSVRSDAFGFYSITVPSGWSGRVTPSKAGVVGFFPAFRNYTSVTINQTAQDYTLKATATFKSVGARDGWVLELAENANAGQSVNGTATTLRLGDDAARRQYRSILSFSTGVLPDSAVITKVTLLVKRQGIVGGSDPVALLQGFMLDMRRGTFGTAPLLASDWQANANKTYGPFMPALTGGWYTFNLTSAKSFINKLATGGGATQIRMRFKLDDNNDAVANYLSLYSGEAGVASRPQLIIEYYVP